ncbi:Holliday junction resolvase RuvX [Patescibacteria group bacterium]|nr:Holliday junction resolvase RuvX [Patescibacteria group bacterium]
MKILAIDYGSKRVGLAIGDTEIGLAFPRGVLKDLSDNEILTAITSLITEEGVSRVVVGEPVSLSGQISEQTKDCQRFAKLLTDSLSVPVSLQDERLTSRQADTAINQGSPKERDELAAVFLLQTWLDKTKQG